MRISPLVVVATAAVLVGGGCGTTGTVPGSADVGTGKTLFQQKCAACHTLADAGTKGTVGPNLDEALGGPAGQQFDRSTLRDVVRGQIAYASPPMPQDLVTGVQAEDVAAYVAQVAGQPVQGGGLRATPLPGATTSGPTATTPAPAGTTTAPGAPAGSAALAQGKAIFTSAGCSGCHTLKAAGATGTTGPDLDALKPTKARIVKQVTNGGKIMPAFKGTLSAAQIDAVATYVSSVAGK